MKCSQHCNWNECQGKDWYALKDIFFCKYQVMWIIAHLELLLMGEWPISPIATSNGDLPGIITQVRTEAYFVKPEEIAAEIEWRLKRTGKDGETLVEEIEKGHAIDDLVSVSKDALNYICGFNRKRTNYSQWLASRNYYKSIK